MRRTLILIWATTIVIAAGIGLEPERTAIGQETAQAHSDRMFARKAASGGKMVVALGRKARMQAFDSDVKRYARRVVRDHNIGMRYLMEAIKGEEVGVSSFMTRSHQGALNRISRLKGASFDRAFVNQQIKAHRQSVQLFKDEVRHGQDAGLKAFAARMLPVLREHLRMARDLEQSMSDSEEASAPLDG